MKLKKVLLGALALSVLLALCGCSGNSNTPTTSDTTTTEVSDTVNIELTSAPAGIHPLKTNDAASTYLTAQIFQTLYLRSHEGDSYVPYLAADMPDYSEDGLTVTIPLREGVTFGNGDPFTAEAVGYMIDCLKDPEYGSQRPSIVESIDSYDIIDDTHITLHLAYTDGVLIAKLAHTNSAIVNPALDKTQDLMVNPKGAGTGAYDFESAVSGSTYTFVVNENYWGGTPEVKKAVYTVVGDEATAVARLQTKEADLYPSLAIDSYETVANTPGVTAVSAPSSAVAYFALRSSEDTAKNPLMANQEFRKVICEAIDTASYVTTVMGSQGSVLNSIIPSSLVGYVPEMENSCIAYDTDAAKATVEANGWSGQTITLLVPTREAMQTLAAYTQAELAKVGINVEIVSEEWATFLSSAKQPGYYDFTILTWSNVTGDGHQMLDPNFSTKNGLRVLYNNAEFDSYVDEAARTTDPEARSAAMLKAVDKIQGDAVVRPVYVTNTIYAFNSDKLSAVTVDMTSIFYLNEFKLNK